MENASNKTIWIIFSSTLFLLFSCALPQQNQLKQGDVEFYVNQGIASIHKGEFDQAISDCTKALEINPRDVWAYNSRGVAYGKKGQYDQAITDYTKALEIYPDSFDAFVHRGNSYLQINKFDQAIHDLNKALEIDPKSPDPYYIRGIVYFKYIYRILRSQISPEPLRLTQGLLRPTTIVGLPIMPRENSKDLLRILTKPKS